MTRVGFVRTGVATIGTTLMLAAPVPVATAQTPSGGTSGTFGLGRAATTAEIEALDIDVRPDGSGLPPGRGSVTDGARVWERACRACHGLEGEGGTAAPVVGRDPNGRPPPVGNFWPYATTLYDYVNRAMPRNAPGTLTPDQVYGVVAWILAQNEIVPNDAEMNAETLPQVVMPGRDRFVPDDRRGGREVR